VRASRQFDRPLLPENKVYEVNSAQLKRIPYVSVGFCTCGEKNSAESGSLGLQRQ
jgi:hypothetical protein